MLKKDLLNYGMLSFSILLSFSLIILFENPIFHVSGYWLTVLVAISISRLNITHPLFWFSSAFALYSTSYTLIFTLGYPVNSGYSKENILFSMIALSIVLLITGVKKRDSELIYDTKSFVKMNSKYNQKILEYILIILMISLFISVTMLFITPFDHKNEMLADRNIFFVSGVYVTRFLSFFIGFYLLLFVRNSNKKTKVLVFFVSLLVVFFSLFTGEKDAMFRFFVVLIMTLFITKTIGKKSMLVLIPIGMIFLIASRYFKYYFVSGKVNESIGNQSFIYNFLNSDFNAAGENLQILLNNPWTNSVHGFSVLITNFISPFLPGGIFLNVGSWFNDTFYSGSYSRAFTLIGQGYVVGGILGIIIVFIILGLSIKLLYTKAINNVYWMMIYIYSIPTIISAFRSTFGTILTDLIRIAIFGIFIHIILYIILKKGSKPTESQN